MKRKLAQPKEEEPFLLFTVNQGPLVLSSKSDEATVIEEMYENEKAVPLGKIVDQEHPLLRQISATAPEEMIISSVVIGIIYTKEFLS